LAGQDGHCGARGGLGPPTSHPSWLMVDLVDPKKTGPPITGTGAFLLARTNKSAFIGFYFESAERHFRILFHRVGFLHFSGF
jgi:hypothetical protein